MKRINIKIKVGHHPITKEYQVSAYLTPVAGLVVHPEVEMDVTENRFIVRRNSWAITQFPTGTMVFGGIYTSEEAFQIVNTDLVAFNWVGLTAADSMVPNDANLMHEMARKVNRKIGASRQTWQAARKK